MNTKEKIKEQNVLQKIWNDQVLSQIISVGLLSLITIVYSLVQTFFRDISFIDALSNTLNYQFRLYKILMFIALAVLGFIILYKLRQRKHNQIGKFDIEQKVGNFTFRELYNAMLSHKMDTPPNLLGAGVGQKIDMLSLFIMYQRQFNLGSEWEHDSFTHYVLGPTLMTYGLTERVPTTNKMDNVGSDMIQTSKIGYEFHALIERWRVFNDETMKDDMAKIQLPIIGKTSERM